MTMGYVSGNWITGTHSGRACSQDDIYTKVNKKTGKCYSVKLCNPNHDMNEKQQKTQGAFGLVSKAVSQWIKDNKISTASAYTDYKKVKKAYDSQSKYATLRGYMIAKGMYSVSADKATVTVDITKRTDFKTAFGISDENENQPQNTPQNVTQYTLNISSANEEQGTVNTSVNKQYDAGSEVEIVATPESGYDFDKWDDDNTNASRTITMNSDVTLVASFKVHQESGNQYI